MKLTLSASLCALLFAGTSLLGGYAQAASSLADVINRRPSRIQGGRKAIAIAMWHASPSNRCNSRGSNQVMRSLI